MDQIDINTMTKLIIENSLLAGRDPIQTYF